MESPNDLSVRVAAGLLCSMANMAAGHPHYAPISEAITQLPEGQRLYASYLIALQAFNLGEYGNSLGVVNTALSFCAEPSRCAVREGTNSSCFGPETAPPVTVGFPRGGGMFGKDLAGYIVGALLAGPANPRAVKHGAWPGH